MTVRVLIADDEALARARLERLVSSLEGVTLLGAVADGDEVLARVREGGVDLVLLDVNMPRLSGTEALAAFPAGGPMVVFCTAHAEHAVKAFDVGAVDYLLKPVELERLRRAVERARERAATAPARDGWKRLAITTRTGVVLVDPSTITHATLEGELVTVFTSAGTYLADFSLQELVERLPRGFERVHRRAVVNLDAIERLEPLSTGGYLARVTGGGQVEVSRQSARELRRRLGLRGGREE